ncbi:MAG: hypothetical protein KatS3mg016_2313 [Fimbriimonadales bacterium]|nr:MAG: hypothetical protein KatS3mg016_2313 [Fimbriimonadales bacterium]
MRSAVEIGYELLKQGRYTEALPFLQRAVVEQPREARVHLYLALAYAHTGDNTNAEKHFAQAIALNSHDAYIFYNWGAYLHRQGRHSEALKAYETAYRLDPALIGAKQAADFLRGGAPNYAALFPAGTGGSPSTVSQPPPVNPADLYTPAARGYRSASGCITAGVLLAVFGLCVPFIGLVGGLVCGVIAILRGSVVGGVVVIVLAIVLAMIGSAIWQVLLSLVSGIMS